MVTEAAQRRHRHRAVLGQLHARRQCREPGADRARRRSTAPATRSNNASPATPAPTSSTAAPAPTRMAGGARQRHLCRRQRRRRGDRGCAAAAPTPCESSVTYTLGAQCREPDADRGGGDQRHRQRARQHPHRQRAATTSWTAALGADTHDRRRSATTPTSSTTPATW